MTIEEQARKEAEGAWGSDAYDHVVKPHYSRECWTSAYTAALIQEHETITHWMPIPEAPKG